MSGDINVQSFSGKVNISNNLLVGSSHLFVDTVNNRVGITTAEPGASLEVNGNVHVETDLTLGGILTGDGSGLANVNSDSGLWAGAGTGSVYLSTLTDKVGIGTTSPSSQLELYGAGKDLTFKYDTGITRQSVANRDTYYSGLENSIKRVGDRNIFDGSLFTPDTTHEILFGFSDTYTQWSGLDQYYPQYMEMRFKLWSPSSSTVGSLTDVMTLRGDGNVGIGTNAPSAPLHVYNNSLGQTTGDSTDILKFGGDSNGAGALLLTAERLSDGSNWASAGLRLQKIVDVTKMAYVQFGSNTGNVSGELLFGTGDATERMRITADGDVGIGTTGPNAKLEVHNSGAAASIGDLVADFTGSWIRIGDARSSRTFSGGSGIKFLDSGVAHYSVGQLDGKFKISVSSGDGNSLFPSGYIEGINMDTSGNVGIGTTSPDEKLDVYGNIKLSNANSYASDRYIFTHWEDGSNDHQIGLEFDYYTGSGGTGTTHSRINFVSNATLNAGINDTGKQTTMSVLSNGNVGIGTTDPNHKLEVSGGILADYIAIPEINLDGARFGKIIEYRYSGMPSTAPTNESSMNSEFGNISPSYTIYSPAQMRYPSASGATNIGRMWIGIIQATSTGVYTFGVNSDDASDLFVAGYRVADWYSGHGYTGTITVPGGNQRTIYLKGGQWYKVKARFEENSGGEAFFALWKKPGDTSFSEIPSSNLGYLLGDTPGNVVTSDDRLKVNETMISNATDTIIKLKPQIYDKFEFIEDVHDTKNKPTRESGLIAQDIWYDAPELRHMVYPFKTPNETREVNEDIQQDPDYSDWGPVAAQVNYFGLIPYLIKSFQELHENVTSEGVKTQEMNEDLQATRTELEQALQAEKEKTKTLESRLAFLETAVASLIS